jgi:hypothetical protein
VLRRVCLAPVGRRGQLLKGGLTGMRGARDTWDARFPGLTEESMHISLNGSAPSSRAAAEASGGRSHSRLRSRGRSFDLRARPYRTGRDVERDPPGAA